MSTLFPSISNWLGTYQQKVNIYCAKTEEEYGGEKRIQRKFLFLHYFAWLVGIMQNLNKFYCPVLYSFAEFAIVEILSGMSFYLERQRLGKLIASHFQTARIHICIHFDM